MPQTVEPIAYAREPAPNPIRWTRRQCASMMEQGILTGRYELIEGEIVTKMGQGPHHAYVIIRLTAWLFALFGPDYARFQLPIRLPAPDGETSEPEPDAAVLIRPAADFVDETPEVAAVLLVVEVSDATLRFDRNTKAALYARVGIPEYWVIDIEGHQLFVHRQPAPAGYAEVAAYSGEEEVAPLARPDTPVRVSELLPPAR
jgi:Uma2 family endonuclease